jgi:hypothetical protein
MSGKSPVSASEDQRAALTALAASRDRGEADRARATLLALSGRTCLRKMMVRLWSCGCAGCPHRDRGGTGRSVDPSPEEPQQLIEAAFGRTEAEPPGPRRGSPADVPAAPVWAGPLHPNPDRTIGSPPAPQPPWSRTCRRSSRGTVSAPSCYPSGQMSPRSYCLAAAARVVASG